MWFLSYYAKPQDVFFFIWLLMLRVRVDIINSLGMRSPYVSIGSFDRQNLFYGAKLFNHGMAFVNELVEEICKYVKSACSTVVYCNSIKDTEQVFFCFHWFVVVFLEGLKLRESYSYL